MDLDPVELHVLLLREQPLVGAEPRLRLRVPGLRRRANPLEPRASARRRADSCFLVREPNLLLLEPAGVVAFVGDSAPAVELEDPAGDVVEEVAVVGHGDDGAGVVGEEPLEPGDGLRVRFVGSSRSNRSGEERSSRQSATRRRSPPERVVTSRSPSGSRSASIARSSCAEFPGAVTVDLLLHLPLLGEKSVEIGVGLGEGGGDRVEAIEQVAQHGRRPRRCRGRLGGIEVGLLEPADGRSGRELGAAARGLLDAGHDPQQRRLPGAVRPSTPIFAPGRNASVMLSSTLRSGP